MAISLLSTARTNSLFSRLKNLFNLTKLNHTLGEIGRQGQWNPDMDSSSAFEPGQVEISKWKKVDSREMGITQSMIPVPPWIVLKVLQSAGFEAYLVGGCVRDLLLNRVPKDFDVITSADLTEIRKKFHHCVIVGRRFPICRVHVKGTVVEVSSFATVAKTDKRKEEFPLRSMPKGYDRKDIARWRNSMRRDFTVNSLFFDPFVNKIYDYANAMLDIRSSKLRTLVPAEISFEEDSARILRGLRLAARLNFSFSKEADRAIRKHSSSILSLPKSRILMEVDYMLSFGAAEASIYLLQRYLLLEILLPVQAAYLAQHDHRRSGQSPLMLMNLLSNWIDWLVVNDLHMAAYDDLLDHFGRLSVVLPVYSSPSFGTYLIYGGIWDSCFAKVLTFHLALINNPQQALVVLSFASLLYHGTWYKGVRFARQHAEAACIYVPEISDCSGPISDDELGERISHFAEHIKDTVNVFTETADLQKTMMKFPGFPSSNLVFISKRMGGIVKDIVTILTLNIKAFDRHRKCLEIDYGSLLSGKIPELRFVLGKIILHTLGCGIALEKDHSKVEKDGLHALDKDSEEVPIDLRKAKKENKRSASSTGSEQKQEVAKKQKVMVSNRYLSKGATNNHELVTDKWPKDVPIEEQDSKKHQGMLAEDIDSVFQNYASKMQEEHKSRELEIKSVLETVKYKMTQPGQLIGDQEPGDDQENKKMDKKHLKSLGKVNYLISKQRNSRDKYLQQQDSSQQSESTIKADKTTPSQTKKSLKTDVNGKQAKIEHKRRGQETLSNLFR